MLQNLLWASAENSLIMAMRELKLPMLKHSWATSMKNSIIRARCFFLTGCKERTRQKVSQSCSAWNRPTDLWETLSIKSAFMAVNVMRHATYHTDLSGHQVTQSVEPVDVGLQVTGFTLPEETLKRRRTWLGSSQVNINVLFFFKQVFQYFLHHISVIVTTQESFDVFRNYCTKINRQYLQQVTPVSSVSVDSEWMMLLY